MRIDGGLKRSLINDGPKEKLSVPRSTFLGGVPADVGEAALEQWHLRNSTNLKGIQQPTLWDDNVFQISGCIIN